MSLLKNAYQAPPRAVHEVTDREVHWRLGALSREPGITPPFDNTETLVAMFGLAVALQPRLISYDLLVGEDTSGRLPALVFRSLINHRRRAAGLPPTNMRFCNGRYSSVLRHGTFPTETTPYSRALIISDVVASGGSIKRTHHNVHQSRVNPVDAGSILCIAEARPLREIREEVSGDYFGGVSIDEGVVEMKLYNKNNQPYKGVTKFADEPYASPLAAIDFDAAKIAGARASAAHIGTVFNEILPQ